MVRLKFQCLYRQRTWETSYAAGVKRYKYIYIFIYGSSKALTNQLQSLGIKWIHLFEFFLEPQLLVDVVGQSFTLKIPQVAYSPSANNIESKSELRFGAIEIAWTSGLRFFKVFPASTVQVGPFVGIK